jgi:branched-chain amino acid transport system substrate-binding protein
MPGTRTLAALCVLALVTVGCETSEVPEADRVPETTITTEPPLTTTPSTATTAPPTTLGPAAEDGVLVIGSLLPGSGSLAALGPPLDQAVQLAVIEVNEAGGVLGEPVRLVPADSGSDADVAAIALADLFDQGADVIVGPAVDGVTRAVFDSIVNRPAVSCLPATTSVELIAREDFGLAVRTAPSDLLQMEAIAQLVVDGDATTVAVLAAEDEVGLRLAGRLTAILADTDVEVVLERSYDPDAADGGTAVEEVVDAGPDEVVLLGGSEGPAVLRGLLDAGFAGGEIIVNDAIASPLLGEQVDPANPGIVSGVRGVVPTDLTPLGAEFFDPAFSEFAGNIDTFFAAQAYDCVVVVALAAAATGASDPTTLGTALVEVTVGGTPCDTFADCVALLEAGDDIDYVGASGVDLDEDGAPTSGVYDVFGFGADGLQEPLTRIGIGPAADALAAADAAADGEGDGTDEETDETDEGGTDETDEGGTDGETDGG